MKKKLVVLIVFLALGLLFYVYSSKPNLEWIREINYTILSEASFVKACEDGSYVVLGKNYGALNVVRLDSAGNILWQKEVLKNRYSAMAFEITSEGAYLLGGYNYTPREADRKFWLAKLDKDAKLLWEKEYDNAGSRLELIAFEESDDGHYILTGELHYDTIKKSDYYLAKVDKQGALIWSKVFGGSGTDNPQIMRKTAKGNFEVFGKTYSNDGDIPGKVEGRLNYSLWSLIINDEGEIIDSQRKRASLFGGDIAFTAKGEYLLYGNRWIGDEYEGSIDVFVKKYNRDFIKLWTKELKEPGAERAIAIDVAKDGSIILLTEKTLEDDLDQIRLLKLSGS